MRWLRQIKMKVTIVQAYSKNKFPFNIGAILIKKFQRTNYSHYAIEVKDGEGMLTYYDSTGYGTRKRTAASFNKSHTIKRRFELPDRITYIQWLDYWAKHEGKSYGYIQLLGLLFKVLNIIKNNPFGKGAKRLICNELVILYLNEFRYTNIKDTDSLDLNDTEKILMKVLYEK